MTPRAMAALTLTIGVLAGACGNPNSSEDALDAPELTVAAVEAESPSTARIDTPDAPNVEATAPALVVTVAADPAGAEGGAASEPSTTPASASSSTAPSTPTTASTTDRQSTTIAPTTAGQPTTTGQTTTTRQTTTVRQTTTARQTTTMRQTTTIRQTTTTASAAVETRPEILAMALPRHGGGNFDPNSLAGRNVLVWFWGPH